MLIDDLVKNPRPGVWCDRFRQLPPTDIITHESAHLLCQGAKGDLYIGVYNSDKDIWTSKRGIMNVEYWQPLPDLHPARVGKEIDRKVTKVRFGVWCDAKKQVPETDWRTGYSDAYLVQGTTGRILIKWYNSYLMAWKNYFSRTKVEYWMPLPPKHNLRGKNAPRKHKKKVDTFL